MSAKIKVLIVDDSRTEQLFLSQILLEDESITIVGTAYDGQSAIDAANRFSPDIITMDLNMPGMNGLEATRHIMRTKPVPILIVTADTSMNSAENAFKLVEVGAVGLIEKPSAFSHADHAQSSKRLCRMVKTMAQVKLVQRKGTDHSSIVQSNPDYPPQKPACIVIGASTGGPAVIKFILESLETPLPVPVFIVQHMSSGFTPGFVKWLNTCSKLPVKEPIHNEIFKDNYVYVAPDDFYMSVTADNQIRLTKRDVKQYCIDTISHFFKSVGERFKGEALALILTGMGEDGVAELKTLRNLGCTTLAQDKETSIVHGMPGEALKIEAAEYEMSPAQMIDFINNTFRKK